MRPMIYGKSLSLYMTKNIRYKYVPTSSLTMTSSSNTYFNLESDHFGCTKSGNDSWSLKTLVWYRADKSITKLSKY